MSAAGATSRDHCNQRGSPVARHSVENARSKLESLRSVVSMYALGRNLFQLVYRAEAKLHYDTPGPPHHRNSGCSPCLGFRQKRKYRTGLNFEEDQPARSSQGTSGPGSLSQSVVGDSCFLLSARTGRFRGSWVHSGGSRPGAPSALVQSAQKWGVVVRVKSMAFGVSSRNLVLVIANVAIVPNFAELGRSRSNACRVCAERVSKFGRCCVEIMSNQVE